MQFKHPEFLYALFLLLIPIIVHLFHLRRFKKEIFTNVEFLKKVQLQTRKSSQLKKWLVLLTRMLALAAAVIAFAQPFIPHSTEALKEKETLIYIDNSFSMQQKGEQGELLQQAVQQVLQSLPGDQYVTVMTNDRIFSEESLAELKDDLLQIDFSQADDSFKTILLKAQNQFSKRKDTQKQLVAISDFQRKNWDGNLDMDEDIEVSLIQLKGKNHLNFSVDSVYVPLQEIDAIEIEVLVSAHRKNSETLSLSLYNRDRLMAKSSAGFDNDTLARARFTIPDSEADLEGKIQIDDQSLKFDNSFYFSLQKPEKIKVVVINQEKDQGNYLKKIYDRSEFDWVEMTFDQLDYNEFEGADFIVLNELNSFPNGLENQLDKHRENGGSVGIIPSNKLDLDNYNRLFLHLNIGSFSSVKEQELKITEINFAHPLYANVFESEVRNFQYPKVEHSYEFSPNGGSQLLSYNNGRPFLWETDQVYIFTAALNLENSNFTRSPIVVPGFYNMAKQSLKLPKLAYTLGKNNQINLPVSLAKDEVLHLVKGEEDLIPQQRRFNNNVAIELTDLPESAGTYQVVKNGESMGHLSFNYDRTENQLDFYEASGNESLNISHHIKDFFKAEINKNQVDYLWKWFVIFALIFLLIEVGLLKFLK